LLTLVRFRSGPSSTCPHRLLANTLLDSNLVIHSNIKLNVLQPRSRSITFTSHRRRCKLSLLPRDKQPHPCLLHRPKSIVNSPTMQVRLNAVFAALFYSSALWGRAFADEIDDLEESSTATTTAATTSASTVSRPQFTVRIYHIINLFLWQ